MPPKRAFQLYDVMPIICKYVDMEDLKNLAQVNKLWREAALRERSKRFYIQHLRYPGTVAFPWPLAFSSQYAECNLSYLYIMQKYFSFVSGRDEIELHAPVPISKLFVKPYVSLLICSNIDGIKNKPNNKALKRIRSRKFVEGVPLKSMILEVDECITTDDVKDFGENVSGKQAMSSDSECLTFEDLMNLRLDGHWSARISNNWDPLGLFFPNVGQRAHVRVTWQQSAESHEKAAVKFDRIAEDLGLDDCEYTKSTILWFARAHHATAQRLVQEIEKKYFKKNSKARDNTEIWTGEMRKLIAVVNKPVKSQQLLITQDLAGLRISGPSVESWTAKIDLRSPGEDIEKELRGLKEKVVRKRHCTGLLYTTCGNETIMRKLKRIFCGISFVGLFQGYWGSYVSVIILTYD